MYGLGILSDQTLCTQNTKYLAGSYNTGYFVKDKKFFRVSLIIGDRCCK